MSDIETRAYTSRIPFARHLGFELTKFEGGQSEIHYTAKPEHLNTFDVTHGGACMTLLDIAMAAAARSDTPEVGVVTIEMKTSFMHPSVGPLVAKGHLMHRTTTLAFTEATIYDEQGRACAHSTGTFKYVRKRLPVGPGSANEQRPPSTD
ncbi:PaaI family thioesterase [Variovorax sp. J22R133]|uniref:PaaI family thioesterase n=1 Tax=Variovorax brevis TaxID=3053503 RepID=UPI002574D608|nr:PaaI family thioesterase [Variovorax sp. J22R133]MDM0111043.1 PaaI family thioesterase [Variovorax sp. J22R133]